MLKLYYAPGTCALASHIALEEAGADYEAERLDFKQNQQNSPEYLAINPKGRVPSLITDRGTLTETPAILAFIAQCFPQARLAPLDDPYAFAQVQAFNSYLCSTVHVAHAHRVRGYRWATEESSLADMKQMVPKTMGACYALIERDMLKGPWVMGEHYTICDPYLYTITTWLEGDGVDLSVLPKVMDHRKRVSERAAVTKALADIARSFGPASSRPV
jgi:glutathione S-transferase